MLFVAPETQETCGCVCFELIVQTVPMLCGKEGGGGSAD